MIRVQATRDWESSDPRIQRIEVLARLADLWQFSPTHQQCRVMSFSFRCSHCARVNKISNVSCHNLLPASPMQNV